MIHRPLHSFSIALGQTCRVAVWLPLCAALVMPITAVAQEATPSQRAELRQLVRERDQLARRLDALDAAAVARLKAEQPTLEINAQQISVQDQLDLVQLRLEILATRYGLPVPPPPSEASAESDAKDGQARNAEAERAFTRGKQRTLTAVRKEAKQFAAAIDFSAFLAKLPELPTSPADSDQ